MRKYLALIRCDRAPSPVSAHSREELRCRRRSGSVAYVEVELVEDVAHREPTRATRSLAERSTSCRHRRGVFSLLLEDRMVSRRHAHELEMDSLSTTASPETRGPRARPAGAILPAARCTWLVLADLEYLADPHGADTWPAPSSTSCSLTAGERRAAVRYSPGLIDVESLRYDENRSGQNGNRSAPGRPLVGGWSGGGSVWGFANGINDFDRKSTSSRRKRTSGVSRTARHVVLQPGTGPAGRSGSVRWRAGSAVGRPRTSRSRRPGRWRRCSKTSSRESECATTPRPRSTPIAGRFRG